MLGVESKLREVIRKSAANKGKLLHRCESTAWDSEGDTTNGDFPYRRKAEGLLDLQSFPHVCCFLKLPAYNNQYLQEAYFEVASVSGAGPPSLFPPSTAQQYTGPSPKKPDAERHPRKL